jgi:hypothetical protein
LTERDFTIELLVVPSGKYVAFLTDEDGNYITDESGNRILAEAI